MRRFPSLAGLASALLITIAAASHSSAADKVTIVVAGIDKQIYLPAMLAQRLGYFKEQGLDADLVGTSAGVQAEDELVAGQVEAVVGFYDHTVDLQSKGKFIETIVQLSQAPGEVELVATKVADTIKSPADFKGQTLGVTGLGSSTDFLTRYLAIRAGLKPGDFSLLGVGAGNTFIAAMKQGQIAAGMTTEPTIGQMVKTGQAKILIDMRTVAGTNAALGGPYPAASLYVASKWAAAHPELAQKLANVFVKTLHYIATHSAAEIAANMPADYYAGDKDLYIAGLDQGKSMFTADGVMPADGPETVLKVQQAFSPTVKGKQIDLSKTYTSGFVKAAASVVGSK
jgi:NitT/TauT family transport system substrate-binding protein